MTKQEIMPDIDWKKIRCATAIKLLMKDGRTLVLGAFDYWYNEDDEVADIVDGAMYEVVSGEEVYVKNEATYLPNPEIERVEIIELQDGENHGSHPEIDYNWKSIDEMYR
jgi:hypothetical protein